MDEELRRELAQLKTDTILIKYTVEQIEGKLDAMMLVLAEMRLAKVEAPDADTRITRL